MKSHPVMSADYDLPEEATPGGWYAIYRGTNIPADTELEEVKNFMEWCEIQGIFGIRLSEAARAIETF